MHTLAKRIVAVVSALVLVGGFRPQGAVVPTTVVVYQQLLRSVYSTIVDRFPAIPAHVQATSHPDQLWLIQELYATYRDHQRTATSSTDSLTLVFSNVSMRYENVESADSIRRIITVEIGARMVRGGRSEVLSLQPVADTLVCSRSAAKAAESAQHRCTAVQMPEPPTSFWENVLEPMVFVAAAVATVLLLFTVRSQ